MFYLYCVKFSATILLVTFIMFIAQTIVLPSVCAETRKEKDCCGACAMMNKPCAGQDAAKHDNKTGTPKCADCPMCTVLMFTAAANFKPGISYVTTQYPQPVTVNLSSYFSKLLKPPNYSFLLYS